MDFIVHVYHHFGPGSADPRLDSILAHIIALQAQGSTVMATLADIQAKLASLTASVANETSIDQSIITLVQGLAAQIAALKDQLAAAIAANDPAALQAVVDGLGSVQTTIDSNAQKIADAVTANTPA